jgi:hypothetical protein
MMLSSTDCDALSWAIMEKRACMDIGGELRGLADGLTTSPPGRASELRELSASARARCRAAAHDSLLRSIALNASLAFVGYKILTASMPARNVDMLESRLRRICSKRLSGR